MPRDAVALAHRRNAQRSECPYSRHIHVGRTATENRPFGAHRSNAQQPTLLAAAMPTSKPYTSGRHRARNRAKNPRHPPVCPKSPNLPRARVPLRFDAAAHRQKAQRFESLQRRPIHTRGRRPRPRQHDSSSKRRQPSQIAGNGYYRETRLALARIRSLGPICPHSAYITSYSNTPTLKLHPRHFSPQNRRPPAPLGYA